MSYSVRPHRQKPTRLPCPRDSPGKNTGVGCHFLPQCMKGKSLSRIRLLATPWTAAYQAPPSMGFSRQEYWSGVPLPSPLFCINTNKCHTPLSLIHAVRLSTHALTFALAMEDTCMCRDQFWKPLPSVHLIKFFLKVLRTEMRFKNPMPCSYSGKY